jgi:hypothetical protein
VTTDLTTSLRPRDRARSRPGETAPLPADPGLGWLPARPAATRTRVLLVAVNLAATAFFLLSFSRHGVGLGPYQIDLDVYRIGGRVWLHGGNLYGALPATASGVRLPFSYPPAAAILLSPLSLVPMAVAGTVLTLGTIALAAVMLRVFLSSLGSAGSAGGAGSWWTAGWLLPASRGRPALVAIGRHAIYRGRIDCAHAEALGFGGHCGCGI